jgi:tripartite-type tricarboxylate transporter receptor subunit TctC
VPTLAELDIDLKVSLWIGLLAPAGTPPDIIKKLEDAVARIVAMPDVRAKLEGKSVIPQATNSADFARLISTEIAMWRQVAQDNNIRGN